MTYPNAAAGLKSIYQAKLVGLISIVLVIIPIVQIFAVAALLVAGFLALVGLAQCRKDDPGYNTAFSADHIQAPHQHAAVDGAGVGADGLQQAVGGDAHKVQGSQRQHVAYDRDEGDDDGGSI